MKKTFVLLATAAMLNIGCDWVNSNGTCDGCDCADGCCESGTCDTDGCGCGCKVND